MTGQSGKNIWVAAGDGDLNRVKELIEQKSISPNAPDPYTYTPMHAAASYAQLHVLEYLIAHGGDVNVTDDDGDTPLYAVETIESAAYLVDHGAIINRRNLKQITPIDHLEEEFPEIASYLRTRLSPEDSASLGTIPAWQTQALPSDYDQSIASENLTTGLMATIEDIMHRAVAEGRDADQEIQQAVRRAVIEGVLTGYSMTEGAQDEELNPPKRSRTD